MKLAEILNLIAIIIIPIIAVIIGQWLQTCSEKRKDKMHIFKTLMTSRVYGWTQESVYCLNIIDIVFADDKKVRNAWKDLYDKYCVQSIAFKIPMNHSLKKSRLHLMDSLFCNHQRHNETHATLTVCFQYNVFLPETQSILLLLLTDPCYHYFSKI